MLKAKWLLMDFGGCLDSDGVHSRELFKNTFDQYNLLNQTHHNEDFQDAYTYSDRKVIGDSLVINSSLREMNDIMCFYIAEKLEIENKLIVSNVATKITQKQSYYLKRNKLILKQLKPYYQLGIISNFSGNLLTILRDFSLTSFFDFVLDSYHVGITKPDMAIFNMALEKCKSSASDVFFIGDNIEKDIVPAKSIGMNTILISSEQKSSNADYTINSLEELLVLTHSE